MHLASKVNDYISGRFPELICDACIASAMNTRHQQANRVTMALETTSDFSREIGVCHDCGKESKVIGRFRLAGQISSEIEKSNKDVVKIPTELAVRACKTLISCVDELTAAHVIKYGHLEGTENPIVLRKVAQDDQLRQDVLPVLHELFSFLHGEGLEVLAEDKVDTSI